MIRNIVRWFFFSLILFEMCILCKGISRVIAQLFCDCVEKKKLPFKRKEIWKHTPTYIYKHIFIIYILNILNGIHVNIHKHSNRIFHRKSIHYSHIWYAHVHHSFFFFWQMLKLKNVWDTLAEVFGPILLCRYFFFSFICRFLFSLHSSYHNRDEHCENFIMGKKSNILQTLWYLVAKITDVKKSIQFIKPHICIT